MDNDDNEDNPGASSAPEGGTTTEEKTDETTTEENAARREIISNCGNIDVGLEYNLINKRITVTILECSDLPNQDRGVPPIIQVNLFPTRKRYVFRFCPVTQILLENRIFHIFRID